MAKRKKDKDRDKEDRKISAPKLNLSAETKRGIAVIIFIVLAVLVALSIAGIAGSLGKSLFRWLSLGFGVMAYVVPLILLSVAISLYKEDLEKEDKSKSFYWRVYFGALLLAASTTGLVHIFYLGNQVSAFDLAADGKGGGFLGALFAQPLYNFLGFWGGSLILVALVIIALLITFDVPLRSFFAKKSEDNQEDTEQQEEPKVIAPLKINSMGKEGFVEEKVLDKNPGSTITIIITITSRLKPNQSKPNLLALQKTTHWTWRLFPWKTAKTGSSRILICWMTTRPTVDSGNIEVNVAIIKKTLSDFGIEVEMGEVNVGPTVTQYTLRPNVGVKLSQIAALQNDLALSLAAHSIRMELPIPGKALVGIEVPNKSTAIVRLREVMQTNDFIQAKSKLAVALGRDVAGHPMVVDLAKMPHMLIAGATGTGKSVAINSLFISLLYRNTPQDVKFIVIDPKRVELNLYNGIPHLLTPVVIENEKAVNA